MAACVGSAPIVCLPSQGSLQVLVIRKLQRWQPPRLSLHWASLPPSRICPLHQGGVRPAFLPLPLVKAKWKRLSCDMYVSQALFSDYTWIPVSVIDMAGHFEAEKGAL